MGDCKGCGAKIQWLTHASTGKKAPVNIEGDPHGNVELIPPGKFRVLTKDEMAAKLFGEEYQPKGFRTTLHFATCPNAEHFKSCRKCHHTPCECP